MTLTRGFSCAIALIAAITAAPPAMSPFISPMFSAGLIEMPPVSKVMPLPTSASGFAVAGAVVAQDDEARLLQRCRPRRPARRPCPSRASSPGRRPRTRARLFAASSCGLVRHLGRRQVVGRLVRQVAAEVRRLGQDPRRARRRAPGAATFVASCSTSRQRLDLLRRLRRFLWRRKR